MNAQHLNLDSKTILQIWLLTSVVAPKSSKITFKIGNKKRMWKPTISESQEGILIHCKVPGDIEKICQDKQNKMRQMNLTMQPFVIIIGPEITAIDNVYIRLDTTLYSMPTVLKALDVFFKIFVTFNACYSKECENMWYLIQWGIYEIHTIWDENIPFLCTALNKIKRGVDVYCMRASDVSGGGKVTALWKNPGSACTNREEFFYGRRNFTRDGLRKEKPCVCQMLHGNLYGCGTCKGCKSVEVKADACMRELESC
ncbi:uncharacterized protein LOC109610488 [Camponotus floridanus]|uniref:uncharacterized protein LOC109610488 n=1 Tax=Camponotus floridanus TaxID=104421 RepID=UPI000DC677B7|nr:uncharacterized protein LOC109610488 [Camponotus floridanus]